MTTGKAREVMESSSLSDLQAMMEQPSEAPAETRKATLAQVMDAFKEIISAQRSVGSGDTIGDSDPTPTELFAVISLTLSTGAAVDHLNKVMKIFSVVLPQTNRTILRSQFKTTSLTLIRILKGCPDQIEVLVLGLDCLGSLLQAQDSSEGTWSSVQTLQAVNSLLAFIEDKRTPVRKVACNKLIGLMKYHESSNSKGIRVYIADFCVECMKAATRSDHSRAMYVVLMLENAMQTMPGSVAIKISNQALRLHLCEVPQLTAAVFRMFDSFFQSPIKDHLSAKTIYVIVDSLLSTKPNTSDMESLVRYTTAAASGFVVLYHSEPSKALELLDDAANVILTGLDTNFTEIHCAVSNSLKRMFSVCIQNDVTFVSDAVNEIRNFQTSTNTPLNNFISSVSTALLLKYQGTWVYILDFVGNLFETIKGDSSALILGRPVLMKLVEIYEAANAKEIVLLQETHDVIYLTMGTALRSMGLPNFLMTIPFSLPSTPDYLGIDDKRNYLFALLQSNIKLMTCDIAHFGKCIVTVAMNCSNSLKSAQKNELEIPKSQRNKLRNQVIQLWSLFPAVCLSGPTDIVQSFPKLYNILDGAMQDSAYPELAFPIITGLYNLGKKLQEKYGEQRIHDMQSLPEDVQTLQNYAPVFLPRLLDIVETLECSDNNFQSCIQCVGLWASFSNNNLVATIAKKLLQQLLVSTGGSNDDDLNSKAAGWMSVMLVLVPCLPNQIVTLLFKTIRPLLVIGESISLQKRAYQVLESLIVSHCDLLFQCESSMSLLAAISDSILTCNVSARHMRLRCILSLISALNDTHELTTAAQSIIREVLICQKDSNKKSRDAAADVMHFILDNAPPESIFNVICEELNNESVVVRSSAIIAISMHLMLKGDCEPLVVEIYNLLPRIVVFLGEGNIEQTRAVLSFLRVCANLLLDEMLYDFAKVAVPSIFSLKGNLKGKFSNRVRAILRKIMKRASFDEGCYDEIKDMIPVDDLPLLGYIERHGRRDFRKRIANGLNRIEAERMLGSDDDNGDDSEDESSSIIGSRKDYRLGERPKATRAATDPNAMEIGDTNGSYGLQGRRKVRIKRDNEGKMVPAPIKLATTAGINVDDDDDDDDYKLSINEAGQVVVTLKEAKTSSGNNTSLINPREDEAKGGVMAVDKTNKKTEKVAGAKRKQEREPGEEYRSKKSGGDVWKSGMLEPHAYIQLDPRMLAKKNTENAVNHFGAVTDNRKNKRAIKDKKLKRNRKGQTIVTGNRKQRIARKMKNA